MLCVALCMATLLCCMPVMPAHAVIEMELPDWVEDVPLSEEEIKSYENIEINAEFIRECANFQREIAGNVDEFAAFAEFCATVSAGISFMTICSRAYKGIMSFLNFTGIVKDSTTQAMESILSEVNAIQKQVDQVDAKLKTMQNDIDTQFAALKYNLIEAEAKQYKQIWSKFLIDSEGEYFTLSKFAAAYSEIVKDTSKDWAKTWAGSEKADLRCLYNADGVLLYSKNNFSGFTGSLPTAPLKSDDKEVIEKDNTKKLFDSKVSFEIVLPAEYLSVKDADEVTSENYVDIIRSTISGAVGKAIKAGKIKVDAGSLEDWKANKIKSEKDIINRITEDMINSMFYEVNDLAANDSYDGLSTTYADKAITLYNRFCQKVSGENGTAPLEAIFKYLSLVYAFAGDAQKDAGKLFAFMGSAILEYSSFVSLLAGVADITDETKKNLVITTSNTLTANRAVYDNFAALSSNYCFPLKGVLSYVDVNAESVIKSYNEYWYNDGDDVGKTNYISDWALVDASLNIDTDDFDYYVQESSNNEALLKNSILDSGKLQTLMYYMAASANGQDFMSYLKDNGVISDDAKHSTTM